MIRSTWQIDAPIMTVVLKTLVDTFPAETNRGLRGTCLGEGIDRLKLLRWHRMVRPAHKR